MRVFALWVILVFCGTLFGCAGPATPQVRSIPPNVKLGRVIHDPAARAPDPATVKSILVSLESLIQMVYQLTEEVPFIHQVIVTNQRKKRLDISLSYFSETEQIPGVSYDFTRIHQLEKMQKDFSDSCYQHVKSYHEVHEITNMLLKFSKNCSIHIKDLSKYLIRYWK